MRIISNIKLLNEEIYIKKFRGGRNRQVGDDAKQVFFIWPNNKQLCNLDDCLLCTVRKISDLDKP